MTVIPFKRAQLYFWDFIIRVLSESKFLRYMIPRAYSITHNKNVVNMCIAILVTSTGGFLSGFLLKLVISLYRWIYTTILWVINHTGLQYPGRFALRILCFKAETPDWRVWSRKSPLTALNPGAYPINFQRIVIKMEWIRKRSGIIKIKLGLRYKIEGIGKFISTLSSPTSIGLHWKGQSNSNWKMLYIWANILSPCW